MTRRDDRFPDMLSSTQIDAAIEQVLHGARVGDDGVPLASFVDDLRVMADAPAPPPSPELTALLAGRAATSAASATVASLSPRRHRRVQARSTRSRSGRSRTSEIRVRVAALGLAGKAAVSLALAATVAAGGTTGILPEPATHFVRRAIEAVTPFGLSDHPTEHPGRSAHAKTDAGVRPGDETGESPLSRPGTQRAAIARAVTDPPPLMNPTTDTTSWAGSHATKGTSPAREPKPTTPPLTPPAGGDPAGGPPPHAGPPSKPKPGPQRDHVPPGRPPSSAPRPGNPHAGGPQPKDHGPADDPSMPSAPTGPRSGPGSPAGPPPGHGGEGSHGGPSPSVGHDHVPHGGPPDEASACGRSPRGGPDGAPRWRRWDSNPRPPACKGEDRGRADQA
jgi:hypothetical protein